MGQAKLQPSNTQEQRIYVGDEIPNTEYITVKRDDDNQVDIFIGNEKAKNIMV